MNPTENLEALLSGLRPRPPSPGLRRSLFAQPPPAPNRNPPPATWLAPLAATALLTLTLATAWTPDGISPEVVLATARAGAPAFGLARATGVEQNAPLRAGFRSTSTGAVGSHFPFLLLRQTNLLTR